VLERLLQQLRPDAAMLPGGADADLVDPELARLVGMPVVQRRDEPTMQSSAIAATR
jgi:hypothetical protein